MDDLSKIFKNISEIENPFSQDEIAKLKITYLEQNYNSFAFIIANKVILNKQIIDNDGKLITFFISTIADKMKLPLFQNMADIERNANLLYGLLFVINVEEIYNNKF